MRESKRSANEQPNAPKRRMIEIAQPSFGEEEWQALRRPLVSGWVTQGPEVAAFEQEFAAFHQVDHAVAVSSCTAGLHLILEAIGCGPGDEVIVPAFTWIATANAVSYCGATPVFVDVDSSTFNLNIDAVEGALTQKTRAVIAVHLFGLCVDVPKLKAVLPDDVLIIEDAACAAGAQGAEGFAGSLGDAAAFSFHPRKLITTGEGGMVTTRHKDLADKVSQLRSHGATLSERQRLLGSQPYLLPDFNQLGYNYRMTDLQAAVGRVQLSKLEEFIKERSRHTQFYRSALSKINSLQVPQEPSEGRHSWQSFTLLLDPNLSPIPRNKLMEKLEAVGISTRTGTHAVHMLGYYRERFGLSPEEFPQAQKCNDHSIAIPLHNKMVKEEYQYVVDALLHHFSL